MLDACGVPAQPLLVSTDGESPLLDELPNPSAFTHMLVMIPAGGDTLYADPTMQRPGLATVPRWIAGQRALTFDRDGTVRMVRIPRPAAEQQGVHAVLELQPTDGNTARIVVRMRLRGQFVDLISDVLERRDTTQVAKSVRRVLGYGLWESCRLVRWSVDERTPERLVLSATFQDTAWAADADRVVFQWATEVADLFTDYPDTTGRRSDVLFERAFSDTVIVRLRDGAGWRVSRNVAGLPVQGDGYAGSFEVQPRADGVDIVQRFEVRSHRLPPAAYVEFYRDWCAFSAFVAQTYEYQRALDDAQVAQMQDYGRRNPADASFALQSVLRLLGPALGGVGDEGRHRRDAIRTLLRPLMTTGVHDSRMAAMVFTCAIEMREGRYRRSDSLIAVARSLSPGNARVMQLAIASKLELGDQAGALAVMNAMSGGGAGADLSLEMLRLCTFLGLADEARAAEQRYFLLHPDPDSTAVLTVRLNALLDAYRCDAAREMFVRLGPRLPRADRLTTEGRLEHTCGRPDLAVPMLEEAWLANPTNVVAANNYAWSCALAGVKLQRAEQLARTVLAMSPNADAIANTLGAVLLRLGRVTEAEALFRSLLDRDDRPWNTATNEYFVGLCEYRTGRRADAKARWIRLLDAPSSPRTRDWLRQSLAATERAADPEDALFWRGQAVR
jgi:tetratricopeptide (TPR) repeat protein